MNLPNIPGGPSVSVGEHVGGDTDVSIVGAAGNSTVGEFNFEYRDKVGPDVHVPDDISAEEKAKVDDLASFLTKLSDSSPAPQIKHNVIIASGNSAIKGSVNVKVTSSTGSSPPIVVASDHATIGKDVAVDVNVSKQVFNCV